MKILTTHRHPSLRNCLERLPGVTLILAPEGQLEQVARTTPSDLLLVQASCDYFPADRPMVVSDGTLGPGTATPHWSRVLSDPNVKAIVLNTPEQIWTWRLPASRCTVIPRGLDLTQWPPWQGGSPTIVSSVNLMRKRAHATGYDIWCKATDGLPRALYGWGNEDIGTPADGVMGYLNPHDLAHRLTLANAFLNSTTASAAPNSLVEAMAVGLPIASTLTYFSYTHLGDRAFLSNQPAELRRQLSQWLANPEPMREKGRRNRQYVAEVFNMGTSVHRWLELLSRIL